EHVQTCGSKLLDRFRRVLQVLLAVLSVVSTAVVSQVGPFGREFPGMVRNHVMDAQRGAMLTQQRVDFGGEPGRVPEFQRPAMVVWSRGEKLVKPCEVEPPSGRQLHENGAEELTQQLGVGQEWLDM